MHALFSLWLCSCQEPEQEEQTQSQNEPSTETPIPNTSPKEIRVFLLQDGTKITGSLEGTNEIGFIVASKSMGTITIPSTELVKMTSVTENNEDNTAEKQVAYQEQEIPAPTRNIVSAPSSFSSSKEEPVAQQPTALDLSHLQISAMQDTMMQDPEILGALYTLQNDPEVMRMIQDPEILMLIQQKDYQGLMKHPAIKRLESNKAIQGILKSMNH